MDTINKAGAGVIRNRTLNYFRVGSDNYWTKRFVRGKSRFNSLNYHFRVKLG